MQMDTANIARRALLKVRRKCGLTDVTVYRDGIRYQLDLNEYIDSEIYLKGFFEEDTTYALRKLIKPGMTIFDIGANSGAHTLRMAKIVGGSGKVVAFEPMPWALKKLETNMALNMLKNIRIESMGLSDKPAKNIGVEIAASWPVRTKNAPPQQLHPIHKGKLAKERIDFSTLDDYVSAHEIWRVDVIKIDTDGYELKVLRGGAETLKRFLPALIVEMDKRTLQEHGDTLEGLILFLESFGYRFYSSENGFRQMVREDVISAKPGKTRPANVVALAHKKIMTKEEPL